MRLFARVDGTLQATVMGLEPGQPYSLFRDPETVAETLDVDEDANTLLVRQIDTDITRFRLKAGQLTRDGTAVPVAPAGPYLQDKRQVEQAAQQLDTLLAKLDGGTNLTAAEVQASIKFLLRFARYVMRWILKRS